MPGPDPDRAIDILDLDAAAVAKTHVDPFSDALLNHRGDANSAGFGGGLQPCRYVDTVSVDVVAVDNDIAEIDADPQHDRRRAAAGRRRALDRQRAVAGIH